MMIDNIYISKQFNSEITFPLIISENSHKKYLRFLESNKIVDFITKMKGTSFEKLNKVVDDYTPDIKENCKVKIRTGKPYLEILEESKIDLIVIATKRLGNLHTALFGSTTDKVIRRAKCSVLSLGNQTLITKINLRKSK